MAESLRTRWYVFRNDSWTTRSSHDCNCARSRNASAFVPTNLNFLGHLTYIGGLSSFSSIPQKFATKFLTKRSFMFGGLLWILALWHLNASKLYSSLQKPDCYLICIFDFSLTGSTGFCQVFRNALCYPNESVHCERKPHVGSFTNCSKRVWFLPRIGKTLFGISM